MTRDEEIAKIKYDYNGKRYKEALDECKTYLAVHQDDYFMMTYKVRILLQLGEFDEAEILVNNILSKDIYNNTRAFALEQGAKIATERKDYEKAIRYYEEALTINNQPYVILTKMAKLYMKLENYDKALEVLQGLSDPQTLVTKARIYLLSGKSALAADTLDEIKEEDLDALTPLKREACIQEREYLEAEIFKKYGMDEQAEKHYKNAFKGNKHSRTYYEAGYALAKMKFEKRELDKSITICNRLIKTADEKYMVAKSSLLCGTIYMSCNDHVNAMAAFSKAGREDVECYGLAQLEIARGNYDAAFKLLTSHRYGSQSLFFRVLYSKLIIYYRQNRYAEFLQLYNIFNTLPNSMAEYKTNVNLMRLILTSRRNELADYKTEIYENMQVVDYSLDRAFMHTIDKYLKPSEGKRFNSLSTIENLFVETKRQIDAGKLRPNYNGVFDRYTVEKEDIAFDGVNILSSASAIVIPETSNIIYMYPNDKSGFALDKIPDVCDLKDDPKIRKRS